jgi:hypothetical protein
VCWEWISRIMQLLGARIATDNWQSKLHSLTEPTPFALSSNAKHITRNAMALSCLWKWNLENRICMQSLFWCVLGWWHTRSQHMVPESPRMAYL